MDRSKFRDTTRVSDLKKSDEKLNSIVKQDDQQGGYAKFLKIEDGVNKFAIYPPHPNDNFNPFIEPVQRWWIPAYVPEKDDKGNVILDKKGNPKLKRTRKPVFDARIHSKCGRDVVAEYIAYLEKVLADNGHTSEEIAELTLPIYGSYAKKIQGITGKPAWVMYAEKIEGDRLTFGRLEVGKAVKMGINKACSLEGADEPIGTESSNPFTELDERRALVIDYNSKSTTSTDYYTASIDSELIKGSGGRVKLYPISDEQLEAFTQYPSLAELYQNSYTTKDFELALEGIRIVDEENEYGIFEYESFLKIVEQLAGLYPEPKSKDSKEEEEKQKSLKDMDRSELKAYIKSNGLKIVVNQSMSDKDILNAIVDLESEEEEEEEEAPKDEMESKYGIKNSAVKSVAPATKKVVEEEEEFEPTNDLPWEKEEEEEKEAPAESAKDKIAAMRARLAKK
jgi:hypothetical protein